MFVELYGWYEDLERDYVFVAMEYVGGGDLSKYLKTPTIRFEAREITRQLLEGLVVMHERHIAHRDIKPQVMTSCDSFSWVNLFINFTEHPGCFNSTRMGKTRRFRSFETGAGYLFTYHNWNTGIFCPGTVWIIAEKVKTSGCVH